MASEKYPSSVSLPGPFAPRPCVPAPCRSPCCPLPSTLLPFLSSAFVCPETRWASPDHTDLPRPHLRAPLCHTLAVCQPVPPSDTRSGLPVRSPQLGLELTRWVDGGRRTDDCSDRRNPPVSKRPPASPLAPVTPLCPSSGQDGRGLRPPLAGPDL